MLPPLEQSILKYGPVEMNDPDHRTASNYVRSVLQLVLTDPRYVAAKGATFCNVLAEDLLTVMGYPTPRALANDHIKAWAAQSMAIQDAIQNANLGCPTLAGLREEPHGHLMVVLPQPPTTAPSEVIIAQAGAVNFYGRQMRYGVPLKKCQDVVFFGWS